MKMSPCLADEIEPVDSLLTELAGGGWVSGSALAANLGVTRSAVSARVGRLRRAGLDIYAVSGKGYKLSDPLDFLEAQGIREQLSAASVAELDQLILCRSVDSTNTVLSGCRDGATRACLAEHQTAGRGRAGRGWASPFATNLHLSVGHDLAVPRAPLAAVSLAVGVAVAEMLTTLGVEAVGLKWPNDLWVGTAKVGGILTEARSEAGGMARLVVGVGLNIAMPRREGEVIEQSWTRLIDHMSNQPSRSQIAGLCLDAVLAALRAFERDGFASFVDRWARYDRIAGHAVDLLDGDSRRSGVARGVGPDGCLLVDIGDTRETVYAGDISLRMAEGP